MRRTLTGAAAASAALVLLLTAPAVAAAPDAQQGRGTEAVPPASSTPACTVVGTPGADRLVGTPGPDVLCGLGGNDVLLGGRGDDVLMGGGGDDVLRGIEGRDVLHGEAGRDVVDGGQGADAVSGGAGRDRVVAGGRGDTCDDGRGDVVIGRCVVDAAGPTIEDVRAQPSVGAGESLTVEWSARDASGVGMPAADAATSAGSWLKIGGSSGWILWCGFPVIADRTAATATSAAFSVECAIPSTAVNGTYSVWISAVDSLGNVSGADQQAEFVVTGGSDDVSAPEVSSMTTTAAQVSAGSEVTVRWQATDETGVQYTIPWVAALSGRVADDSGRLWATYGQGVLVSGDARSGSYEVTVRIREDAPPGEYTLWVSAGDLVGNRDFAAARGDGGPVVFTVLPR